MKRYRVDLVDIVRDKWCCCDSLSRAVRVHIHTPWALSAQELHYTRGDNSQSELHCCLVLYCSISVCALCDWSSLPFLPAPQDDDPSVQQIGANIVGLCGSYAAVFLWVLTERSDCMVNDVPSTWDFT